MKTHYLSPRFSRRLTTLVCLLLLSFFLFASTGGAQEEPTSAESSENVTTGTLDQDNTESGKIKEKIGSVSVVDRFKQGGKTMIFLLFLSIIAVTFFIERLVNLRRSAVVTQGMTNKAMELWEAQNYDDLLAMCRENKSTLSEIIRTFVSHRHCPAMELSMLAGDVAGRDMRLHMQKAYPLAIVATLSPLLGLFGTVIGILESFEIVAAAGSLGDASILAAGISKALVTTAMGLAIAVPSLAAYHFFKMRTNELAMELEGEANDLLTSWFMSQPENQA